MHGDRTSPKVRLALVHAIFMLRLGFRLATAPAFLKNVAKWQEIKPVATEKNASKITRRKRGFERASSLVSNRIRSASETRGFAVSRLLTHWADVVGPDIAAMSRPVNVNYGRGFGATLTLLTTGAQAPMLEMQKETIRERVNACYGYAAISQVRITQTAATGFSEGRVSFDHAPSSAPPKTPRPITPEATQAADGIADGSLREALERLGSNVMSNPKR